MASQNQRNANRKNARKSTGLRTLRGKAKSRLNAARDGLTGQVIILSDHDCPFFEQLKTEMLADFDPKTAIGRKLAHAIDRDTWRLDHLRAIEMNVYSLGLEKAEADAESESGDLDIAFADAQTYRSEAPRFELMSLCETRINRSMHRNLTALRDLQTERKRLYQHGRREEILLVRFNEISELPIVASTVPSRNGFAFSDEEIATATVRQRRVETAAYRLENTAVCELFGDLSHSATDSFLQKEVDRKPFPAEAKAKIHGLSPESIALCKMHHPEEFGLRKI